MTLPRVVVTQWIHPEVAQELRTYCDPVLNEDREPLPKHELLARCQDAEGLMVFMPDRIDAAFLDACPRLRIVVAALKGFDNFDVAAMKERCIVFCVQPDLLTLPTAELALALMLGLGRHLLVGDHHVRSEGFQGWRPKFYGTGLHGRRVGILGFGAVGKALARLLRPFETKISYHDTRRLDPQQEAFHGVHWSDFVTLLADSEFLLPLLPLTEVTHHLLGKEAFAKIRPGCLLVNVSRGSVVDENAVAECLAEGRLGGYAADVFEMEDWARPDRPIQIPEALRQNPDRTLFTPHLGSADASVRLKIEQHAAVQLKTFFEGQIPEGAL